MTLDLVIARLSNGCPARDPAGRWVCNDGFVTDPIRELLESPIKTGDDGSRWYLWLGLIGVLAAAVVAILAFVQRGEPEAVSIDPLQVPTTTAAPLVPFESERPIVYHPTVLPEGWESCQVQLGLPTVGDEMCNPEDDSRWVKIAVLASGPPGGSPIEAHPGISVLREDPPQVGVTVGQTGYKIWAEGLTLDTVVEIASSLPIASPDLFDVPAESNVATLDESTIVELLGYTVSTTDVRSLGGGSWAVTAPGLRLDTFPLGASRELSCSANADLVMGLEHAELISAQHALIVGERQGPDGSPGADAVWCQRNRYWHLSSDLPAASLADRAIIMESTIAGLP
jgi:LPXTG-motif cell wall-anchored protein